MTRSPRISLGLPVYRGADYLRDAVTSLQHQSFEDFELVISDNASPDETGEIARELAISDPRIRYVCHEENIGAHRNYNSILPLVHGEYFKWMAHDDLMAPDFLARCVDALDNSPEAALAFTQALEIDEDGEVLGDISSTQDYGASSPYLRLRSYVADGTKIPQIFGVFRRSVLAKSPLLGSYPKSDTVFMYEMAMRGQFCTIDAPLFLNREHRARQGHLAMRDRTKWYFPDRDAPLLPRWSQLRGFYAAIHRVPMSASEKSKCYGFASFWAMRHARDLGGDLLYRGRYEADALIRNARTR